MEPSGTPGDVTGTALWFSPADSKTLMSATGPGGHSSVLLDPAWLRPLAAWFAGEAQPMHLGDRPGTLYGRSLVIHNDETAVVWSTHTWARLGCRLPFGPAQVTIGPRGKDHGWVIKLSPGARGWAAARLRRVDSGGWTEPAA